MTHPGPELTPAPLLTREALEAFTQAVLAYLSPSEAHPEPVQNVAWALTEAGPLRACLRCWFNSLPSAALEPGRFQKT